MDIPLLMQHLYMETVSTYLWIVIHAHLVDVRNSLTPGTLLLTWINFNNPSMDK